VPQALAGVATVALVWDTVRPQFGDVGRSDRGSWCSPLTPVVVRDLPANQHPTALLVLLLVAAWWAALRAVDDGRTRWLVLCGVLVGFGYLTKQLVGRADAAVRCSSRIWSRVHRPCCVGCGRSRSPSPLRRGERLVWVRSCNCGPPMTAVIGARKTISELDIDVRLQRIRPTHGHESAPSACRWTPPRRGAGPDGPGFGRLFQEAQIGQIAWLLPPRRCPRGALVWRWRAPAPRCRGGARCWRGVVADRRRRGLSFMARIFTSATSDVIIGRL